MRIIIYLIFIQIFLFCPWSTAGDIFENNYFRVTLVASENCKGQGYCIKVEVTEGIFKDGITLGGVGVSKHNAYSEKDLFRLNIFDSKCSSSRDSGNSSRVVVRSAGIYYWLWDGMDDQCRRVNRRRLKELFIVPYNINDIYKVSAFLGSYRIEIHNGVE